ncbi:MAG: protein kinase [Actinomycetota bacterium]|nr:protein kinase [Actinomycetota bacterium]
MTAPRILITEGMMLDSRYRLEELLGRGGTAEVYRGTDVLLGRSVAVKVFDSRLTDLNTVVRQRNEMQLLAALNHPNLIAVYDARVADNPSAAGPERPWSTTSGHTYLVMELVQGATLADRLSAGAMAPEQVAQLATALAMALRLVHSEDLVHRDIKPANILLSDSGQVKLSDFGLARILTAENRLTSGESVIGTAAYFSPEQARGADVGPPGDIYSLGLVLLECLTGQREFPGEPVQSAVARLLRDPVIPADLPPPWPALLAAMTNTAPSVRPSADELITTLGGDSPSAGNDPAPALAVGARVNGDGETAAWSTPLSPFLRELTTEQITSSRRRRHRLLIGLCALIALTVVAAIALAHSWGTHPGGAPNSHLPASSHSPTTASRSAASHTLSPSKTTAAAGRPAAPVTTSRPVTTRQLAAAKVTVHPQPTTIVAAETHAASTTSAAPASTSTRASGVASAAAPPTVDAPGNGNGHPKAAKPSRDKPGKVKPSKKPKK